MSIAAPGYVLVTGGTGFVARYCIAQLLGSGWRVRATLRNLAQAKRIENELGIKSGDERLEFVVANLDHDAGWDDAASGCDAILHVASPLPSATPMGDQDYLRPARDGTLRVLRAAAEHRVRRVVITSSSAAVNYGRGSVAAASTEADWSEPNPSDTSGYERSKIAAEQSAWAWKQEHPEGPEIVTICPAAVIGPVMGRDIPSSVQIISKLIDGSLPGLPRIGFSLVDVRDLADLHVRALTAPNAANQRYIGSGPFLWMDDIAGVIRAESPREKTPKLKLPDWIVRLAALGDPVLRSRLFELGKSRPLSSEKAIVQLGWRPRAINLTIRDTVESLNALTKLAPDEGRQPAQP